MAVTEPGGGTDVLGALRTSATIVDGGWSLTGEKVWSTGSLVAEHLLVLARTASAAPDSQGLTMFLVPNPAAGLTVTPIPKLGMRALASCSIVLDDVFVPDRLVLGQVDGGWRRDHDGDRRREDPARRAVLRDHRRRPRGRGRLCR